MDKMIWKSDIDEADLDAAKEEIAERFGGDYEPTDEEIYEEAHTNIEDNLGCEVMNLESVTFPSEIFLLGKIVRWNGSHSVYNGLGTKSLGKALEKAIQCFDGDNALEIGIEDGKVLIKQWGHDNPTSPAVLEFRSIEGFDTLDDYLNEDGGDSTEELLKHSASPVKAVCDVYGWEVAA